MNELNQFMRVHFAVTLIPGDIDLRVRVVRAHFGGNLIALRVRIRHTLRLAARKLIKGRDSGIDIAVLDQRPHEAEEECEQKRADVAGGQNHHSHHGATAAMMMTL